MSDTFKHKINAKFKVGLIGLSEVPISVRKFWSRKNFDKGEQLLDRSIKREKEFNKQLIIEIMTP